MICWKTMVVYHWHGQTGWSMVWANGTQNSGLVNFILESHSPFVQIISIYQKWQRRPETGIKVGFEEMKHKFCFGILCSAKRENLFRCSVAPGNFPLERPKKSCSIYFLTGFSGNFLLIVNNQYCYLNINTKKMTCVRSIFLDTYKYIT